MEDNIPQHLDRQMTLNELRNESFNIVALDSVLEASLKGFVLLDNTLCKPTFRSVFKYIEKLEQIVHKKYKGE